MRRQKTIYLSQVLREHDRLSSRPGALKHVLGDPHLYKQNRTYRAVRNSALELGYTFTSKPPFDHTAFPLNHLDEILRKRKVPFLKNIAPLRRLEERSPRKYDITDFEFCGPAPNYLMHESAHGIAHSVLLRHVNKKRVSQQTRLMTLILGEATANTADCLALLDLTPGHLNEWLAKFNFYQRKIPPGLRRIERYISRQQMMKLTLSLFLYSNFMFQEIDSEQTQLVMKLSGIDEKTQQRKDFKAALLLLERQAFGLNPMFRMITTKLYLKTHGFMQKPKSLYNFDPVEFVIERPEWLAAIDDICSLMTRSIRN